MPCLLPEIACIGSSESINIQTEVSYSKVEHQEVAGIAHLPHPEEGKDADGIEEESQHP